MKITDVKIHHMRGVQRNWTFVKLMTDEGIYGWGEGTLENQELAVEQAILALVSRHLMGMDPTHIERHWQVMYRHGFWRGGPVLGSAVSALDQALWDITGKAYGVPVYKLLGGPVRDRVRVYTHANSHEEITHSINDLGFTAFKCTGWFTRQGVDERAVVEESVDRIAGFRERVGPDIDIMYDNSGLSWPQQAIQMLRAMEPCGLYFFEEPCQPDNLENLRRVREHANVATPIATGERLYHRWDYRYLVENQLADIVQPDVCHCFGISELRRIAAIAETYYIRIAPHNPNGPVSTAASLHVCAASPNFAILESIESAPWTDRVQTESLKFSSGYLELPTKPGLGVDLDEEVIASRPYDPPEAERYRYRDGAPL
jgi:galactonate dehydratase